MSDLGNKKVFATNLRYYMQLNNVTQTDICKTLKFSASTFSDWVNAKTYPRIDKIEMLSDYFNINKSNLIENRIEPEIKSKDYYLEQYINTLGYKITGDYSEGCIILKTPTTEYELEEGDLDDLYNSTETFIKFKLLEIMNKRRKFPNKPTYQIKTLEEAKEYLKNFQLAAYGGSDLDKLSDEELIEYAKELKHQFEDIPHKYKK